MVTDAAALCRFVDAAVSPLHAVAAMAARLEAAGFERLAEEAAWELSPGSRVCVVRDGGSIVALRIGDRPPADAGFRIVGAHTDSPTFRLRPRPGLVRHGMRQIAVAPYGGVLRHTWMDRDLGIAGRVAVRSRDGGVELRPVHLRTPVVRIPSLAIHLDRDANDGVTLNPDQHLLPLLGDGDGPPVDTIVAEHAGVDPGDVLGTDLVLVALEPARAGGHDDAWVFGPRLDNLLSCHVGVEALLAAADTPTEHTQVLVANDHEEVGSASAEGAAGSLLASVLARVARATDTGPDAFDRAVARSLLVSADAAHALHPNYADRHDRGHRPVLNGGPVLKVNANQRYASDAGTSAWFRARCDDAGVPLQHFAIRADLPCGSTIGPLTATRTGIPTVDVGAPLLSMHSVREQAGAADVDLLGRALVAHYAADARLPARST